MKFFPAWLKWLLPLAALAVLALYAAWLFLPKGSGAGAMLAALAHPSAADLSLDQRVVLAVRLPRILTALLVGAVMAVSGLLLQTMTRNPLASPSLLSINAGAGLGIIFTGVFLTSAAAGDFSLTVTPAGVNATALLLAAAVFALGLFFAWNSWRAHERSLVALAIAAFCTVAGLAALLFFFCTARRARLFRRRRCNIFSVAPPLRRRHRRGAVVVAGDVHQLQRRPFAAKPADSRRYCG